MPTRNVNLTEHFDGFVEASVASGRYQNASEVVRDGLRLLEQRQREDGLKLERLRAAVAVGEAAHDRGEEDEVAVGDLGRYLGGLGATAGGRDRP